VKPLERTLTRSERYVYLGFGLGFGASLGAFGLWGRIVALVAMGVSLIYSQVLFRRYEREFNAWIP
jgi:hypothetical protein